ncbi:uncharacterized protein [Anabrus simplex]|uniref:uncharacterized protein n=1 Tax=Anabrus simplex TaxID=316456 RepID=UPI0034DD6762
MLSGLCHSAPVEEDVLYDQRQNGTENYRVHVDGVVVAVAPAETLLSLIALADDVMIPEHLLGSGSGLGGDYFGSSSTTETVTSSEPSSSTVESQPQQEASTKPTKKIRGKILLSRLLMPLLRRL